MNLPTVRAIIPVHNRERFLRIAVESLLAEKLPCLKIIVVDDASTDLSLSSIRDLPVEIKHLNRQHGAAHARNAGLEVATEDFILFFDSDDILIPGGIQWRLEWLIRHPQELVVGGYLRQIIDAEGKPLNLNLPSHLFPQNRQIRISWNSVAQSMAFPWALPFYLFRRQLVKQVGFLDTSFQICDDQEFLFRILRFTSIPFKNRVIYDYRLHSENISLDVSRRNFLTKPKAKAESYLIYRQFGLDTTSAQSL